MFRSVPVGVCACGWRCVQPKFVAALRPSFILAAAAFWLCSPGTAQAQVFGNNVASGVTHFSGQNIATVGSSLNNFRTYSSGIGGSSSTGTGLISANVRGAAGQTLSQSVSSASSDRRIQFQTVSTDFKGMLGSKPAMGFSKGQRGGGVPQVRLRPPGRSAGTTARPYETRAAAGIRQKTLTSRLARGLKSRQQKTVLSSRTSMLKSRRGLTGRTSPGGSERLSKYARGLNRSRYGLLTSR